MTNLAVSDILTYIAKELLTKDQAIVIQDGCL